jgi:CRISPR/Cas system CSM-associated protein Csm4 (group 5 of RAMP superfamily)
MSKTRKLYPKRYIPKKLTRKDKQKQKRELEKSKKMYKKNDYYTRKKVASFKSKPSKHVDNARKIYDIQTIKPSQELAKATGCSIEALKAIEKKGQGAYYSSGSRPNQTAHSWGRARLASSITAGKSAAVDYHILSEGCKKSSKALKLANKSRKKHNYGKRKVPKIKV